MIMKILALFVFITCSLCVEAQTLSFDKIGEESSKQKREITVKRSSMTNRAALLPSDSLQRFKINIKPTADTYYSVFLEEYIGGNCQQKSEVNDSLITRRFCKANRAFKAEIIPDNTKKEKLAVSVLVPEAIKYVYKKKEAAKVYKYVAFKPSTDSKLSKSPFLFIYEDDRDATQEMHLKQVITNDSLRVNFDPQKKPFIDINRYMVLFIERENN